MAIKITTINMLILDHSSNDAEQTINILRNSGHPVRATQITNEEDLEEALEKQGWDLFIVRDNMKNPSAEQCLKIVKHFESDIPFIMLTDNYSVERTTEVMQLGMKDLIPEDNDEYFRLVVERELTSIEDRRHRTFADKALKETDKRNELLLDSSRDAIAYVIDGMHIYVNIAYVELFGYKDAEALECMPIMDLIDSNNHADFKKYLKDHTKGQANEDFSFAGLTANGDTFNAYLSMTNSEYDGESCTQIYIKTADVSDEELEKKLKEISAKDRLTGLYNRHHFIGRLSTAIKSAIDNKQLSAVFYLDLDNFDKIQDEHGIVNSDLYLKEVSQWLTDNLKSECVLARVGDCTFTILINIKDQDEAKSLGENLCKLFSDHLFEISNQTITDSLSIGICPIDKHSEEADTILSNAHFAASRVQSKGGNGCRLHSSTLDSLDNRVDAQTEMEIQDARDAGLLKVKYEPIVKLHGLLEKLFNARLTSETEDGETKGISEIYTIGASTSTAAKLDQWLMQDSFLIFSSYQAENSDSKLKISLSAASLIDDNLVPSISNMLSEHNLPASAVIFEFREDDVVTYLKKAIQVYSLMGQQGMTTALGGLGNTFDSESIINSINTEGFSWVSIEQTLLTDFISNKEAQAKVEKLLAFAHVNDLLTIAPSIKEPGTLATIWPMNIGHIHGEYIALETDNMNFDFTEVSF